MGNSGNRPVPIMTSMTSHHGHDDIQVYQTNTKLIDLSMFTIGAHVNLHIQNYQSSSRIPHIKADGARGNEKFMSSSSTPIQENVAKHIP